jgi:hypothetical protein
MKTAMKFKTFPKILVCVIAIFVSVQFSHGQTVYKTAVGLAIDVGDGGTWVGPHVKHFFDDNQAGEAALQFGTGLTILQLMYQYHQPVQEAEGLQWYIGLGGALGFPDNGGNTLFGIVPAAGLDYKLANIPIDLFLDWRPKFMIYEGDNEFLAARFGLGLRFTLKN